MKYRFDGYNWLVKLDKGEKLIENITKLVIDENIRGAWVSGIGAAESVEVGFYKLESKSFTWKTIDDELEILSLQGNVAWKGEEPVLHIHGTFSNEKMEAFGGHIKELEVGGACEVLLHRWYESEGLKRGFDDVTGLNQLDFP